MSVLAILFGLVAALAAQVTWALVRRQAEARRPLAVMLAVATAGYLATGRPLMPARPAPPLPVDTLAVESFTDVRRGSLTIAGDDAAWLTLAEALELGGNSGQAAEALNDALLKSPRSPDLWVGLGTALVIHADGAITPAARMAFRRGESLAPDRDELKALRRLAERRAFGPETLR